VVCNIALLFGILLVVCFFIALPPWPLLAQWLVVNNRPEPADVIITLSGDSERDLYAAELYRKGMAPKIIMTGCGSEAARMAKRAVRAGVPEKDVLLEQKAESTYENAVFSKEIVLREKWESAIVVSSSYHMRRSKLVFERVFKNTGVRLIYCAATDSGFNTDGRCTSDNDRKIVKREYLKLFYYWFRYW